MSTSGEAKESLETTNPADKPSDFNAANPSSIPSNSAVTKTSPKPSNDNAANPSKSAGDNKPEAKPSKTEVAKPSDKPSNANVANPSNKASKSEVNKPSAKPSSASVAKSPSKTTPSKQKLGPEKKKRCGKCGCGKGKSGKCCKCCKLHPGVCKCWHPCSFCIYPILIIGLGIFAYEMYLVIDYISTMDLQLEVTIITIVSVLTIFFFFMLLQLVYFLIYYESVRRCGIILFTVFFLITFLLSLATFVLTFVCAKHCPYGKNVIDVEALSSDALISYIQNMRLISILHMMLIVLLMHMYLYHCHYYRQEMKNQQEQDRRDRNLLGRFSRPGRGGSNSGSVSRAQGNNPRVNVFYVKI